MFAPLPRTEIRLSTLRHDLYQSHPQTFNLSKARTNPQNIKYIHKDSPTQYLLLQSLYSTMDFSPIRYQVDSGRQKNTAIRILMDRKEQIRESQKPEPKSGMSSFCVCMLIICHLSPLPLHFLSPLPTSMRLFSSS